MSTFTMRVELGNAACSTIEQLGQIIQEIGEDIERGGMAGHTSLVRDMNGNKIGHYIIPEDTPFNDDDDDDDDEDGNPW